MALKFRRGTTAQKSGSLSFGEPYVNTTLGTLQIGLDTGDVTLTALGTSSNISVAGISGSSLDITGNAKIDGNLSLGGQLTIGDATSDTVNVVASLSSSLIPQTSNAFDLGSSTKIWRDLYISTGSIKIVSGSTIIASISTNADGSQTFPNGLYSQANIVIGTGSYVNTGQFQVGRRGDNADMNAILGISIMPSLTSGEGNVGIGRGALYNLTTGFDNIAIGNQAGYGGNHTGNITIGHGTAFSLTGSSANNNVYIGRDAGGNATDGDGNVAIGNNALIGAVSATNNFLRNVAIGQYAGMSTTSNSSRNIYLGAYAGPTSSIQETYKFYVGNGDNGTQPFMYGDMTDGSRALDINASTTISGSLRIKKDLIIEGSSSIQNISASNVVIGAAYVTLNTFSPTSRYAGFNFIDSGSAGGSGSLWYDSVQDEFIQIHKGNGTNVTSSHFVQGPQTYDNLGNETYLTNNKLVKGTGLEHIVDSTITDDGTTVSIANNIDITGSIKAPQLNTLATYTGSVDTRFTTLATTTGSINTSLTNLNTTTASLNTSVSNINTFTASMSTTSNVRFGSLGIGMAASGTSGRIDASGDIVAYSTSDKNFKENITPIPNAIDKIRKISGNTYDWKVELKDIHGFEGNDVGVIAQEIEEVLPQLVTTRETGYKAVKYDKIVALLIEGIKEQQQHIDNLTIQVEELKKQKGL
jgi:hypothetical protein